MKYNKIVTKERGFKGSVHNAQEDSVALITTKVKQSKRKHLNPPNDEDRLKGKKLTPDDPDLIKHFKLPNGIKYKVGDTRDLKREIFYFCDSPTYQNPMK